MTHLTSAIIESRRLGFSPKPMILLTAMLFVLCVMPLPVADAAQVTLGWDANSEPDLEGYVVYRNVGSPGPPYDYSDTLPEDELADPLHPKATLTGLREGNAYYIALTAYNTDGVESGFSNDVCVEVLNGVIEACSAVASKVASAASVTAANGGGSGSSCFISASSCESLMFSKFIAGRPARRGVMTATLLLLLLIAAVSTKAKKRIAHRCL